jgi:hypothetical protein
VDRSHTTAVVQSLDTLAMAIVQAPAFMRQAAAMWIPFAYDALVGADKEQAFTKVRVPIGRHGVDTLMSIGPWALWTHALLLIYKCSVLK